MQAFIQTFRNLGTVRLMAIGGVAIGLVVFFIFLSSRLSTPDMSLLYGDLDTADSAKIVAKLETLGIAYELRSDGRQILVPSDRALRLRMTMAQDGLPNGGSIGYEIFDKTDALGTTDFVQNINLVRALEGELSRTIREISTINEARVHLVLPKRELFSRRKEEPRASVFLKVRGNNELSKPEVQAIQHLVAAAVPGLSAAKVSIIDGRGRLLARGTEGDESAELTSANNEDLRRSYQQRLTRTIEELVERSVGPGRVRATVNVDMDFDRITTNEEVYDPTSQVARSTQTVEETSNSREGGDNQTVTVGNNLPDANQQSAGGAGPESQSNRTEETVNYEISRTVRNHVRETGVVRRLSVAVLIDGNYVADEKGAQAYEPRSQAELDQLSSLVRSAIGYDAKRGDTVEVVNMKFASLDDGRGTVEQPLFGLTKADYFRIAELLVLAVVGILVVLLVVRPLVVRTLDALPTALGSDNSHNLLADQSVEMAALPGPQGTGMSATLGDDDDSINIEQIEGRVRRSTLKKIAELVDKHPEETVSIIRQWLYQEA